MFLSELEDLHARSHYGVGDWSFDALSLASQHQSVLKLVWLLRGSHREPYWGDFFTYSPWLVGN